MYVSKVEQEGNEETQLSRVGLGGIEASRGMINMAEHPFDSSGAERT